MKQSIIITFLLLGLIGIGYQLSARKAVCSDCNVVIIAVDALQASHVSSFGYKDKTTPTIDALSQNGFSFKNAFSAAPWTVPSYMSIFTGLFPSEHKVVNKFVTFTPEEKTITNLKKVSPEVQTLAEVMKSNGYQTAGFTGDAGVGAQFGYNQGFDVYKDGKTFGSIEDSAKEALEWINEHKDQKLFLFLHGYDAHGQFNIPVDYKGEFIPDTYTGPYTGAPTEQRDLREKGLKEGKIEFTDEDTAFWQGLYDSKIKDADTRLSHFIKSFNHLGLRKKTIIILISDHGTEVYEHKRLDHGHTLYDELIHVPLIFVVPGLVRNQSSDTQVSMIDIAPTLIDLLGIKPDKQYSSQLKGHSLMPLLTNKEMKPRDIYIETDYRGYTHKRGIRSSDGWKYILTLENNQRELYNIKNDPSEKINLVEKEPKIAFRLDHQLKSHLEDMGVDPYQSWSTSCLPVYNDQCIEAL